MKKIFQKIARAIDKRPFIIGVDGMSASGKSTFAKLLSGFLDAKLIELDDFHNPKKMRKDHFNDCYDLDFLIKELLQPIADGEEIEKTLAHLHIPSDTYTTHKDYSIGKKDIVILEGLYLNRKEIRPFLDYSIHLEVNFEKTIQRAIKRDVPIYGKRIIESYRNRYDPAYKRYLERYPAMIFSDLVIDNNNYNKKKIIKK